MREEGVCTCVCATNNAGGDISKAPTPSFPSNCFNTHPEAVFFKSFLLQVEVEEESGVAAYLRHADVPHITLLPGGCTVTIAPCGSFHATWERPPRLV